MEKRFARAHHNHQHFDGSNRRHQFLGMQASIWYIYENVLTWYMNLSITTYQDLSRKLINQFSKSKHQRISTANLFNVCPTHSKSMRMFFEDSTRSPSRWSTRKCLWESFRIVLKKAIQWVFGAKACVLLDKNYGTCQVLHNGSWNTHFEETQKHKSVRNLWVWILLTTM